MIIYPPSFDTVVKKLRVTEESVPLADLESVTPRSSQDTAAPARACVPGVSAHRSSRLRSRLRAGLGGSRGLREGGRGLREGGRGPERSGRPPTRLPRPLL